jgi:hypothetical protein
MSTAARSIAVLTALLFAVLTACNKAQNQPAEFANGNPADGNLAPAEQTGTDQAPPSAQTADNYYSPVGSAEYSNEPPAEATDPPPPLPDYSQPPCPGDNYLWTPGYWNYASAGYYWVPGVWVTAPWVGALWTPPWWGYDGGVFLFHAGFWGPHIGFYGGINYGFGYTGRGYYGAYWNRGTIVYNRAVTNVNVTIVHNVYDAPVRASRFTRTSYNGGRGGIDDRPTAQELAVQRDPRTAPVPAQVQHAREASANRAQFVAGRAAPAALVAPRPLATSYKAPEPRPPAAALRAVGRAPETHAQVPSNERPGVPPVRPQFPENRPQPQAGTRPPVEARPSVPARPEPQASREETRPAFPPHPEPQARPEPRTTVPPRAEVQPRPEPRAVPQRPQAQVRPEAPPHPEAQPRPQPQARPEARPAPHTEQSRPAPEEKKEERR